VRRGKTPIPNWLKEANENAVLQVASSLQDLDQSLWSSIVLSGFSRGQRLSVTNLLAAYLHNYADCQHMFCSFEEDINFDRLNRAKQLPPPAVFPCVQELEPAFRLALRKDPDDGQTRLYLGHLLFHLGRHAEGRAMWKRAAELGAEPVIAYRALGMAAKTLDNDLPSARDWLTKANQADPKDSIVARDLANVLFAQADKADSDAEKRALATEARDRLKVAFAEGKGRSDFVALLARAQNRLDEFAETARMLDSVRVTIWEGAHEVHDLFVQSHLALGEAHLKAGRATEALAEFNRALEYPANLATGKLENAREAHINFARGNALAALGRKTEAAAAWKLAAEEPESKDERIEAARTKAKEALGKVNP
jgi:tetratricopeptide (TPR) repeat protein